MIRFEEYKVKGDFDLMIQKLEDLISKGSSFEQMIKRRCCAKQHLPLF